MSTSRELTEAAGMVIQINCFSVPAGRSMASGKRAGARHVERRAVLEYAARPPQRELVLVREVAVDLDRRESPGVGADIARPVLDELLDVAIALLKVMLA